VEHLCPVTCFCASGSGIDLQDTVESIFRLVQSGSEFNVINGTQELGIFFVNLSFGGFTLTLEFLKYLQVISRGLKLSVFGNPFFIVLDLLQSGFGLLGVIPESRIKGNLFFIFYFYKAAIDVKDTSLSMSIAP
jgi:hypothetical protein